MIKIILLVMIMSAPLRDILHVLRKGIQRMQLWLLATFVRIFAWGDRNTARELSDLKG